MNRALLKLCLNLHWRQAKKGRNIDGWDKFICEITFYDGADVGELVNHIHYIRIRGELRDVLVSVCVDMFEVGGYTQNKIKVFIDMRKWG